MLAALLVSSTTSPAEQLAAAAKLKHQSICSSTEEKSR
jgi:hypothetical protein